MIAFVVYAVLIWYAAARWRRRWEAFAWVGGGIAGLVLVALFHLQLSRWTDGRIYLQVMQWMLYPYTGLVGLIGLFLACLPRHLPEAHCPHCEYDLRGLTLRDLLCPECGSPYRPPVTRGRRAKAHPAPASPGEDLPAPASAALSACLDPDPG